MEALPIDERIGDIVGLVRGGRDVVLVAPPGCGKTTRVPAALMDAGLPGGGAVLVLEPRRVAARLAARRVAAERGERLGDQVGYRVRFERVDSPRTRLWFLTEGLLTRRLLDDPELAGVSVVVFDEFHERSIHADLALGLVREVQGALRADLRVVVMSATLDARPLADQLNAVVVEAHARRFEVELDHAERRDDARIAVRAARAVRREIDRQGGRLHGDALVFLPGAGEIAELRRELDDTARELGFDVLPLYGDLPVEAQDRAIGRGPRPRVVASTNVAETSITLDGIRTVIDSGLARVSRCDARTGVEQLALERISKASADQRAGRAGRQGPGRCVRLFTLGEYRELADALEPEVLRVDLCAAVLALKSWGIRDAGSFPWITRPPAAALAAAERLLAWLAAIDGEGGAITALGRELLALPVHPRVARMLVEARRLGCGRALAVMAALCESRPLLRRAENTAARSDLLVLRDRFLELEAAGFDRGVADALGVDAGAARAVDRERRQLAGLIGGGGDADDEDRLLRCVTAGFPDRIARRREREGRGALMVGGAAVMLDEGSAVREAPLFAAVSVAGLSGNRPALVRIASEVRLAWLEQLYPGHLVDELRTTWNDERGRAEGFRVRRYLDLVVEETRSPRIDAEQAERLLIKAATHPRFIELLRQGELGQVLLRIECLARLRPDLGLPAVGDELIAAAVRDGCVGGSALAEIRPAAVIELLLAGLPGLSGGRLDRLVPERVLLPSGRKAPITYRAGHPPLVSARMQEFFGTPTTPRIGEGTIPLAIDLQAPNGRSVQITQDLHSFWRDLYPKERRELARRYPRHSWPDDPASAAATNRPLPRRR